MSTLENMLDMTDAVSLSRMIANLEAVKDYYDVSGTNEEGMVEVIDFLCLLREKSWLNGKDNICYAKAV